MNKTDMLEADTPAVPQEPVRNDMSIQLLERLIKTLTNLGYATPEGGIEAFNADLPTQLYHLCFGVDRVLSALKTAVPQEPVAWQPIETAPKVEYEIRQKRWQIERAAPDLLEALQAFVNHGTCYSSDEMQKAKDAIAKATGEQA